MGSPEMVIKMKCCGFEGEKKKGKMRYEPLIPRSVLHIPEIQEISKINIRMEVEKQKQNGRIEGGKGSKKIVTK